MRIWSDSFESGSPLDPAFAFGQHHPEDKFTFAGNRSPHIAWSDLPEGTRTLVLLCTDLDAPPPPAADNPVLKEGETIPPDHPRAPFFHWVLVDVDPAVGALPEGAFSDGVTPKGKGGPESAQGTRSGLNDYTKWFAGDADMGGRYHGYDGPAPPWNDSIVHRYRFTLFATDLGRCPVEGSFSAAEVEEALRGHILDQAEATVTYKINPEAK